MDKREVEDDISIRVSGNITQFWLQQVVICLRKSMFLDKVVLIFD